MPRRARQASSSGIYHVMLRGVNRDPIFLEDEDRERFLLALRAARDASSFAILAYCLMDNHVHLVMQADGEPIGSGVRRVGVRYAGWFNRKYDRVGHLFQDRFKSVPVDDDAHLVALLRYVWNNPVDAGLVDHPDAYRWSSRRMFGRPQGIVDADLLGRLVATDPLGVDHPPPPLPWEAPLKPGPSARYSDEDVAGFLERACGVAGPEAFRRLRAEARSDAVHRLRQRSVPFAGSSQSTV